VTGPAAIDEWVVNAATSTRWPKLQLGQLWRHRELIQFFALRDLKVRYKQAMLGVAWAGLQPLLGALTFTILFNRLAKVDVGDRSYFAFALVGFGVWTYFSSTLSSGTGSLLYNSQLLTKVSFPRIVAPASTFLPGLIDLSVALCVAVLVSRISGDPFSPVGLVVGLPLGLALLVLSAAGPVLLLSALVVKYRDAQALVSFGLQFVLFASPVAYPPELVPGGWRTLLYANPLTGALGLLRAALTGADLPSAPLLLLSTSVAIVGTLFGLAHFRRSEREFADII
jgi:ABC-type polysaccharide/polyol phosphate export permease